MDFCLYIVRRPQIWQNLPLSEISSQIFCPSHNIWSSNFHLNSSTFWKPNIQKPIFCYIFIYLRFSATSLGIFRFSTTFAINNALNLLAPLVCLQAFARNNIFGNLGHAENFSCIFIAREKHSRGRRAQSFDLFKASIQSLILSKRWNK